MYKNKLPTKAITRRLLNNEYVILFTRIIDICKSYNICIIEDCFYAKTNHFSNNVLEIQEYYGIDLVYCAYSLKTYISNMAVEKVDHIQIITVLVTANRIVKRTICTICNITMRVTKVSYYLMLDRGLYDVLATIMFISLVFP